MEVLGSSYIRRFEDFFLFSFLNFVNFYLYFREFVQMFKGIVHHCYGIVGEGVCVIF